jgi:hypothetical protein
LRLQLAECWSLVVADTTFLQKNPSESRIGAAGERQLLESVASGRVHQREHVGLVHDPSPMRQVQDDAAATVAGAHPEPLLNVCGALGAIESDLASALATRLIDPGKAVLGALPDFRLVHVAALVVPDKRKLSELLSPTVPAYAGSLADRSAVAAPEGVRKVLYLDASLHVEGANLHRKPRPQARSKSVVAGPPGG